MEMHSFRRSMILRELSADSRISITDLAKKLKCSRITAAKALDEIISKYDIKFTMELNEDLLGISQRHLLFVKLGKKPKLKDLQELFSQDSKINCAFLCKGDFDIIIHAVTNNPKRYIMWESILPGQLADYGVEVFPSQLMEPNFGYLPISSTSLLKFATGVDAQDKALLGLLCENSRMDISEIASRIGVNRSTVHYRMHTLVKSNIIKRFTISINKPPQDYILAYAVNYHFNRTSQQRSVKMMEYYKHYDPEMPLLTTFQLLAPMSGSYRFLGVALFEDEKSAMDGAIKAHRAIFEQENVTIKHARITDVIKGYYPFRNVDIVNNYNRSLWKDDE